MLNGFISYAHEDYKDAAALERFLRTGASNGGAHFWWDVTIEGGQAWNQKIMDAIAVADVFALLITNDFLVSDYITTIEMPAIRKRIDACKGLIVPVILGECFWEPFYGGIQAIPTKNKRIKHLQSFNPRKAGYHATHMGLLAAIKAHTWPATVGASP